MMHGYGRRSQAATAAELGDDDEQDTMTHGAAYGGIFHVEEEDDERDRVVYEELDDSARKSKALLAASERRANAEKKRKQAEQQLILERPKELFAQHAVFAGALSGGEEEDDEDESNPFASLLQAAPTKAKKRQPSPVKVRRRAPSSPSPPLPSPPSPEPRRRSPPTRITPPLHPVRSSQTSLPASTVIQAKTNRRSSAPTAGNSTRSLAPTFEAADARPARWTRNVSTTSTNKRRQSAATTTALAKQQAEAKRRKSLPASMSSLDSERQPVGRRLSDVLQKATVLSQQRTDTSSPAATRDQSFEYTEPTRETADGIADTVREMRDEPFQTQFFSPSKLRNGASSNRRPRADAVLAKIRGSIGDAIRKATRKTNRDLTLLRSQGQTLLRHGEEDSAGEVHSRDFVVVRLGRAVSHPQMLSYEAVVEDSSDLDKTTRTSLVAPSRGLKLTVLFSVQDGTAHAQQLTRDVRVKVFAPFQILNECFVPGLRRKKRKFLVGTSLFEIVDDRQSTQ